MAIFQYQGKAEPVFVPVETPVDISWYQPISQPTRRQSRNGGFASTTLEPSLVANLPDLSWMGNEPRPVFRARQAIGVEVLVPFQPTETLPDVSWLQAVVQPTARFRPKLDQIVLAPLQPEEPTVPDFSWAPSISQPTARNRKQHAAVVLVPPQPEETLPDLSWLFLAGHLVKKLGRRFFPPSIFAPIETAPNPVDPDPLPKPMLTIVDNEDGTGAVATISGSASNSTNTVYVAKVEGILGQLTFTSGGSRTGDGTVNLAITKGFYFAKVDSMLTTAKTTVSDFVYFAVTTGEDEIHERILQAVVARINLLSLDGIAGGIHVRTLPDYNLPGLFPYVLCTIEGELEDNEESLSALDEVVYPVRVMMFDTRGKDTAEKRSKRFQWRRRIRQAFLNQRLTGVSEVFDCDVQMKVIVDPPTLELYDKLVGGLVLKFRVRETRGLSS